MLIEVIRVSLCLSIFYLITSRSVDLLRVLLESFISIYSIFLETLVIIYIHKIYCNTDAQSVLPHFALATGYESEKNLTK